MPGVYLNYPEAQAMFRDIVGSEISPIAIKFIVKRHRIGVKRYGFALGIALQGWKQYCLARTNGPVLTRAKSTYKKRGPKPKPKLRGKRRKKPGKRAKPKGRAPEPNSRRSQRKKRQTAKKISEGLARRKAAEDW
jgi:hypothetical protein